MFVTMKKITSKLRAILALLRGILCKVVHLIAYAINPLNIKLGKFYKTRDGRKAYCWYMLSPCTLTTCRYYFIIDESYVVYSTDRDGKHLTDTDTESALDIIEEWKD